MFQSKKIRVKLGYEIKEIETKGNMYNYIKNGFEWKFVYTHIIKMQQ